MSEPLSQRLTAESAKNLNESPFSTNAAERHRYGEFVPIATCVYCSFMAPRARPAVGAGPGAGGQGPLKSRGRARLTAGRH